MYFLEIAKALTAKKNPDEMALENCRDSFVDINFFGDRANFSELFSCLKNVDAHGTLQALAVDPLFSNGPLTGSKDLKNRSEDLFFKRPSHFSSSLKSSTGT